MFGVNPDLVPGRNNHDGIDEAPKLTAKDLIVKLSAETTDNYVASDLYLLVCLSNPENIAISNPEEKAALRKAIERYFVGPTAVLAVATPADPAHSLTCGSRQLLNFAMFLDSPALALHVASRAHNGLGEALTMLFETLQESPESFQHLVGTLFPKFGTLSGEELSQRLSVIEALGHVAFYPRPRPIEFGDRLLGPTVPVVPMTKSARTELSEALLAFLDRTQLFKGNLTHLPEAHASALDSLSRTIAVGGLIIEPHQIRRALPSFPELINATSIYIAKYSQGFMGEQLPHAAGMAAINWGDALTQALESEAKLGSLAIGKCLVNLGVAQLNGVCDANLILRICKPRSKEFSKFSAEITDELIAQLKAEHSPLKRALCPGILPPYIHESPTNQPYAERTAFNVSKLKLFDCLLQHEDREVRDLAAAEMRNIGHQFRSFLFGENSGLYSWTQLRASRPYRLASRIF